MEFALVVASALTALGTMVTAVMGGEWFAVIVEVLQIDASLGGRVANRM